MSSFVDNNPTTAFKSRSRRRRHDAQASRQALLDAATELFDDRGYDATTVREIGERAAVDPVSDIMATRAIAPVAATLRARRVPDATLRAELIVATMLGISLTRAGGTLAGMRDADVDTILRIASEAIAALAGGPQA